MNFRNNHFVHFIITLAVLACFGSGLFLYQHKIDRETQDVDRISSAKLIVLALDNYHQNFNKYPEKLEEIKDFLSPIPVDPVTKQIFPYTKTEKGFELTIPQETHKGYLFQK